MNLVVSGEDEGEVMRRAELLSEELREPAEARGVEVLGPAPAPIAKLRRRHRWHLLVRGPHGTVQQAVRELLARVGERETAGLSVDVDPVSLM